MSQSQASAAWDALVGHLERVYASWGLPDPKLKARMIVRAMKLEGWRVPLPPDSRPPPYRGRGSDPRVREEMILAARLAVRAARRSHPAP